MERVSESKSTPGFETGEDPAVDELLRALAHVPRASREPRIGDVIDQRYEIRRLLGQGGMGLVFAVQDRRTDKTLALKWMATGVLRGDAAEARSALARFEREARIAAKIAHPNLVDVYDVRVDSENQYLVMELLHGETLRARLERGPLAWQEVLSIVVPALRGVAALHRAGVVHRDLKPDNIFLCHATGRHEATTKVLDLGISHEITSEQDSLTKTGSILGTPAYMPLEQLRGQRDIGPEADVYALGVVLYEALAGARPFKAHSALDQAVLLATERPPTLSERVPGLPLGCAHVVMRALARHPEERFASADALLDALLDASSTYVEPASDVVPWRKHRVLPLRVIGILVALVAASSTFAWVWVHDLRPRRLTTHAPREDPVPPAHGTVNSTAPRSRHLSESPSVPTVGAATASTSPHDVQTPSAATPSATRSGRRATRPASTMEVATEAPPAVPASRPTPDDRATSLSREDF